MAFSTTSYLQLTDFLSSPSYIIVQSPTQSLEWHVWSSSSGNNCHAVHRSLSSGASGYECTMGFLPWLTFLAKPAYKISSRNCHRNVSLPSGASLWNGMFGRVEGQYTTLLLMLTYNFHGLASWNEDEERAGPHWLQARSWLIRPIQGRQAQLQSLMTEYCSNSFCTFCLWERPCGCFQRRRQYGWWWDTRHHGSQIVWPIVISTEGFFSSSPWIASRVLFCCDGERRDCGTV